LERVDLCTREGSRVLNVLDIIYDHTGIRAEAGRQVEHAQRHNKYMNGFVCGGKSS